MTRYARGSSDRDRLLALLAQRSVRFGDFALSSGGRSDYYIDARTTTMCAEGQLLVGRVGYTLLTTEGLEPTHVGGLTLGADPVAYAIAHRSALEGHPIDGFSVRARAKEHGTGQRIEGGLPAGARCIVVEDAVSTGRSILAAAEAVQEASAEVVALLALIDREQGGREKIEAEGFALYSVFTAREVLDAARSVQQA
jgi:orotate phosphoribosyltransferase